MHLRSIQLQILSAQPTDPQVPHYAPLCERHPGLIQTTSGAKPGDLVLVADLEAGTRTFGELTRCVNDEWSLWCWDNMPDEVLVRQLSDRVWQEVNHPGDVESALQKLGVEPDDAACEVRHV